MFIDKYIRKYIVFLEDSLLQALDKISHNKKGFIIVVDESGIVEGVLTDGDFRRWMVEQKTIDLHRPVFDVANKEFLVCEENEELAQIAANFSERIQFIPLVDKRGRLISVALQESQEIIIENFVISEDSPTFIIAEIGNNHNGSLELAKKLVDLAVWAGADCAKFQMRDMASLYKNLGNPNDSSEDLGTQYTLDLLSKYQLKDDELFDVFDYCRGKGIIPLCTPWDIASLEKLNSYGLQAFKVASADLTNHDLLRAVANTGKPMIVSTGMSTEIEIRDAVRLLNDNCGKFILLHCNSTYPAPFKDINLSYLDRLREIGNSLVGYSGHERGINIAIAAVTRGAKVIEKHFTLDKNMEGNDHKVSLLPDEFKTMVQGIREVEQALGDSYGRRLSQGELINRENLAKSLVINCDLKKGELITEDMIAVRSPGKGLPPYRKNELIGKRAKRDFKKDDFFYESDLKDVFVKPRNYKFRRPFGVPVRFHDALKIAKKTNLDLVEFHLSYKDLEEEIKNFFEGPLSIDFVVHSPELFADDHILDLCSSDKDYREKSLKNLQKVIDVTNRLKHFFPNTKKPLIVVNVGGFSFDNFISVAKKIEYYERLKKAFSELDTGGIELIPQTMPPFPWHIGGQRFHNLFVYPNEVCDFCRENKMRICLDVSHSKLACNYLKIPFSEFLTQVAPYAAHLHIADAEGVDGEGLQIGDGDIDFNSLASLLDKCAPNASFIPEIWQGHKNEGEGFWIALEKLERWF